MCQRIAIQCIVPPYINDKLAESANPQVSSRALTQIRLAARMRAFRVAAQALPTLMVSMSPNQKKNRLVYDAGGSDLLPGKLVRTEGQARTTDTAANEAYEGAGATYDFFYEVFGRNSLDDRGMTLISSVHVAEQDLLGNLVPMGNAFWNGEQMAYGDGDGVVFKPFTRSVDVIGHELTHGVQSFESNLEYRAQPGALNEHFADVFGILVRQKLAGESARGANWVIGSEVLVLNNTRRGIRDMENPGTAFVEDPDLGTDPQPNHMSKIFTGRADRQGVHINSGIPNRAFVLAAKEIGGNAWEVPGRIWYKTLLQLNSTSQFIDCARVSVQIATAEGEVAKRAVENGWKAVGIQL